MKADNVLQVLYDGRRVGTLAMGALTYHPEKKITEKNGSSNSRPMWMEMGETR